MFPGVLSIGALPPSSPYRGGIKTETLHFQSLPWHVFRSPQVRSLPPTYSSYAAAMYIEWCPVSRIFFHLFLRVPSKRAPHLQVRSKVPLWRGILVTKAIFYISLAVPNEQGVLIILQTQLSLKVPSENNRPPDSHPTKHPVERQVLFQGLLLHTYLPSENTRLALAHIF